MLRFAAKLAVVMLGLAFAAPARADADGDQQRYRAAYALAVQNQWDGVHQLVPASDISIPADIIRWMELTRPESNASFDTISDFVQRRPDWPNLAPLRKQGEQAMPSDLANTAVLSWFKAYDNKPLTTGGFDHFIETLVSEKEDARALAIVREHWVLGAFGATEEHDYLVHYGSWLLAEDHLARLDRLLWDEQDVAARRLLPLVDAGHRNEAEARLALAALLPGVDGLVARVPSALAASPGLIFERLRWHLRKDHDADAMALLALAPAHPVLHAPQWWAERAILVRHLLNRGDKAQAYTLAAANGQTDGPTLLQAEFTAGWLALRTLAKPAEALTHFQAMVPHATMPISKARAFYWMGRATEDGGDATLARRWYTQAAAYTTTFYGQLAAQRLSLGEPVDTPPEPKPDTAAIQAFENRDLVQASRWVYGLGASDALGAFLHRVAATVHTPTEFALGARLAEQMGRADIAVSVAKDAGRLDVLLVDASYPMLDYARTTEPESALVHAVIRQESTFDTRAVSTAGARGLMQLMPTTAQHVAVGLGLDASMARLTTDPAYNVQLGSSYLAQLLDRFTGSYVLAVAAYNAGPTRVTEWIAAGGDPRDEGTDVVDWIEAIPVAETRNYVQRVLENVEVYRSRLGGQPVPISLMQDLKR